jgi:hypothetical protein
VTITEDFNAGGAWDSRIESGFDFVAALAAAILFFLVAAATVSLKLRFERRHHRHKLPMRLLQRRRLQR